MVLDRTLRPIDLAILRAVSLCEGKTDTFTIAEIVKVYGEYQGKPFRVSCATIRNRTAHLVKKGYLLLENESPRIIVFGPKYTKEDIERLQVKILPFMNLSEVNQCLV